MWARAGALAPLCSGPPPVGEERPAAADPAQILGSLLDMPGSLRLGALLEGPPPADGPAPPARPEADALRGELALRVAQLRDTADRIFEQCATGPTRLPGDDDVATRLPELAGARAARLRAVAEQWAGPFHGSLAAGIERIRGEALVARRHLARELPGLGARAARLEELDRLLIAASRSAAAGLFARIAPQLADGFQRELAAAVRTWRRERRAGGAELSAHEAAAIAAAWTAPGGWLGAHLHCARRWLDAVTDHEAGGLQDLLAAAIDAEAHPRSDAESRSATTSATTAATTSATTSATTAATTAEPAEELHR